METTANREQIIKVTSSIENFDEWFKVSLLDDLLKQTGFRLESTGHNRLLDYLIQLKDLFKIKVDISNSKLPIYYATFIGEPYIEDSVNHQSKDFIIIPSCNKIDSRDVIRKISENWKLDAKLESHRNYFYHLNEVNSIINGSKYYIIGRKGSGKSSISEFLLSTKSHDTFTEKLSFKNFPFNELYDLDNPRYTEPNQYITIWKYLIYSTVVKLMIQSEGVDSEIRSKLSKVYNPDPIKSLSRTVSNWISAEFGASIIGTGITLKLGKEIKQQSVNWIERVNILEDIIIDYCDNSKYFIIFDELDEDYRKISLQNIDQYNNLITSLFKAVQDIKYTFNSTNLKIYPVVFLRDDIYSLIKDADKNKWRDFKIEIEWNAEKIKKLLAYRISRDIECEIDLDFKSAWNYIFNSGGVRAGTKGKNLMNSFDYITRSTHLRPRDYIRYIQVCSEETLNFSRNRIAMETIKFVDRAFSNYLRDEIVDEIYPILPDIEEIFQIISNLRKWKFSSLEFKNEYVKYLRAKTVHEENIDFILDTLYRFSVIGNQHKYMMDTLYFKYLHTNMNLNRNELLVLHRGLFKALQII